MASSLVLCRSTMGFMAGFGAPCTCSGLAPFSMRCASAMALIWTPVLFSVGWVVCFCSLILMVYFLCWLLMFTFLSWYLVCSLSWSMCNCVLLYCILISLCLWSFLFCCQCSTLSYLGIFFSFHWFPPWMCECMVVVFLLYYIWDNLLVALIGSCVWHFRRKCQLKITGVINSAAGWLILGCCYYCL